MFAPQPPSTRHEIVKIFLNDNDKSEIAFEIPDPPSFDSGSFISHHFQQEILLSFGIDPDVPVLLEKKNPPKVVSLSQPWRLEAGGEYRLRTLESRCVISPVFDHPRPQYNINKISGTSWETNNGTFLQMDADVSWTSSEGEVDFPCFFEMGRHFMGLHHDFRIFDYSPSMEVKSAVVERTKEKGGNVSAKAEATQSGGGVGISGGLHWSQSNKTTVFHENYTTNICSFPSDPPFVRWVIKKNKTKMPEVHHLRKIFQVVWREDKKTKFLGSPRFFFGIGYEPRNREDFCELHTYSFWCNFEGDSGISFDRPENKAVRVHVSIPNLPLSSFKELPILEGSKIPPLSTRDPKKKFIDKEEPFLRVDGSSYSFFYLIKEKEVSDSTEITVGDIIIDLYGKSGPLIVFTFKANSKEKVYEAKCALSEELAKSLFQFRPGILKDIKFLWSGKKNFLTNEVDYFFYMLPSLLGTKNSAPVDKRQRNAPKVEDVMEWAKKVIKGYDKDSRDKFQKDVGSKLQLAKSSQRERESKEITEKEKKEL